MLIFCIALFILFIDQLSKFIILKSLQPGDSFPVIKNIFHISFILNRGVAFGIFSDTASTVFIWIAIICVTIITFICCLYKKMFYRKKSMQISLSLILAGAIGNLIDRIRLGCVIDFLDFRIWPVFNIADSAITIGTLLLLLQMFKTRLKKG